MIYVTTLVFLFLIRLRFPKNRPISRVIQDRYSRPVFLSFRKYEKLNLKLEKLKCDLNFLFHCKAFNVLPKFLHFKLYRKDLQNSQLYQSWQYKLLSIEINSKKKQMKKLECTLSNSYSLLSQNVSWLDLVCLNRVVEGNTERVINKIKYSQSKKLNNLGVLNSLKPLDPSRVIFNYSDYQLSSKESNILAFGLNFRLPIFKLNYFNFFLSFEKLYDVLSKCSIYNPHDIPNILSDTLKGIANKYFYNFKPHKVFCPFFNKDDFKTLRNLSKNNSIIVSRPDKGLGVVLLNRSDYLDKMTHILSDHTKFKLLASADPLQTTLRCEDKINRFLRKLKKEGVINQYEYDEMYSSGSSAGVLYGLPKVHKPNIPLRPILSACNTSNFNLAKYLVPKLAHLTTNSYTVKNSYTFAKEIVTNNDINNIMCSLDVESLFTNIPLDEVIDICIKQLFPEPSAKFHNFSKNQFRNLLKLSVKNTYFFFNGKLYEQIDGVAMGSPLGPTLANIFLCYHENKWLTNCPNHYKPTYYRRYVDDTFLLFRNESQIPQFLSYMNQQHPNIKFTLETEENNQISFLDTTIVKEQSGFATSVYRKKTFTGLGSNFLSYTPMKFKTACLKTLIHRAYHLSSSYFNFDTELKFLKEFFINNCFPPYLFHKHVKHFLNQIYNKSMKIPTVPRQKLFVKFPYYGYITDKITKDLNSFFRKFYPQLQITIVNVNNFSIQSFFKQKEALPDYLCSSVIYKYNCMSCNAHYIGSSKRQFRCRIDEHRGFSVRTGLPFQSPPFSAIREHSLKYDHIITPQQFKILAKTNNNDLKLLESLYIYRTKPSLNSTSPLELNIC